MVRAHAPAYLLRVDIVPMDGLPAPEATTATLGASGTWCGVSEVAWPVGYPRLRLNWRGRGGLAMIGVNIEEEGIARERRVEWGGH